MKIEEAWQVIESLDIELVEQYSESEYNDWHNAIDTLRKFLQKEPENNDLEKDDGVEATIVYPYSDFEFPEILPNYMELHEYLKKHNIKGGDKVIVQVRKKEN